MSPAKPPRRSRLRCAIYTRKSLARGTDQQVTSLDAQRDLAQEYIKSQRSAGWIVSPLRYDDGGFTGANADRPALRRLLEDIAQRRIEVVVVYKLDRLSRSLRDFVALMDLFREHNVAFASVSERFDTSTPVGRMLINLLATFAQFERELISERTRDKIEAARRRGAWTGGRPPFGYARGTGGGLVIVEEQAKLVRWTFDQYLSTRSTHIVARQLNQRDADGDIASRAWTPGRVHRLLTHPIYAGKILSASGALYDGRHAPIISVDDFQRAARLLAERARPGRRAASTGFLLSGLLLCGACGNTMTTSSTVRGKRRYRYYRCRLARTETQRPARAPSVPTASKRPWYSRCATLSRGPISPIGYAASRTRSMCLNRARPTSSRPSNCSGAFLAPQSATRSFACS